MNALAQIIYRSLFLEDLQNVKDGAMEGFALSRELLDDQRSLKPR